MGAPDLLAHLQAAGLVLSLTPADGLHVAPKHRITADHRAAIQAERDALVAVLRANATKPDERRSGNPLMSAEDWDEAHRGGWTAAEIDTFVSRRDRFVAAGRADAEDLAERLTLRDRQADDRRLCLECTALTRNGCDAARRGRVPGAGPGFVPLVDVLQRCPAFTEKDPKP